MNRIVIRVRKRTAFETEARKAEKRARGVTITEQDKRVSGGIREKLARG